MLLHTAVFTSFAFILEVIVIKPIASYFNSLIVAAIISATAVFSIPSFILAMITPISVKIKNDEENEVGIVSGKISSISTIGCITGTFCMGFLLIPYVGISIINMHIIFTCYDVFYYKR